MSITELNLKNYMAISGNNKCFKKKKAVNTQ